MNDKLQHQWFRCRFLVGLSLLLCTVEGCYTTMVRVDTIPSGSTIHFDTVAKGETPAEFEVDWYGKHKITLDHPQYGRRVETVQLKAPAYLWFPFDFLAAILPFKVTNRHEYSFDLTQASKPETEANTHESKRSR